MAATWNASFLLWIDDFTSKFYGNESSPDEMLVPFDRQLIAPQLCRWQQWRREGGGQRGHPPRSALRRSGIWRGENMKFWNLVASGKLPFALQTVIFYTLISPNTSPILGLHPNSQCSTAPHKAVCTPRNLHCWPDCSFTCCKTVQKIHIVHQLLFYWQSHFNVLHWHSRVSKFCIKLGNSACNLVIWSSLNFLQPNVRF